MSKIRIAFPDPIRPESTIAEVHDAIRKSPIMSVSVSSAG
jgi:hypothetical protein